MLQRLAGGLTWTVLLLSASTAWSQATPAVPQPAPSPSPPWMFPAEPPMLEYVLGPGTEACRDEEDFLLELAIVRDARRDAEFLPFDLYDDERALVRITLSKTPAGKFEGLIEHVPPEGRPAADPVVKVNSECRDLVRDLAFAAAVYVPFLERAQCADPAEPPPAPKPPAPPAPPPDPPPKALPLPAPLRCDPDREGDAENDAACKRLLAKLDTKYGRDVDFSLLGGGLMTLAYTSDPGPGFLLGATVQGEHWSVGLEVQTTLPAPVRVTSIYDADVSTFVGLVVPCVRLGKTVTFVGCGVVGAGVFFSYDSQAPAAVQGIPQPAVRIGPRAGLEIPLDKRFAFFAFGEVSFTPIIQVLEFSPPPSSWEASLASVFLSAGFSVRLGDQAER